MNYVYIFYNDLIPSIKYFTSSKDFFYFYDRVNKTRYLGSQEYKKMKGYLDAKHNDGIYDLMDGVKCSRTKTEIEKYYKKMSREILLPSMLNLCVDTVRNYLFNTKNISDISIIESKSTNTIYFKCNYYNKELLIRVSDHKESNGSYYHINIRADNYFANDMKATSIKNDVKSILNNKLMHFKKVGSNNSFYEKLNKISKTL